MRHPHYKLLPRSERPRHRVAANYPAVYLQGRRRARIALTVSPFSSPADIAGLKLWLDAAAGTGVLSGDPVAQWEDQSGLGNHASQSEPAQQAILQDEVVNGRPVLRFDADDGYTTPLVLNLPCTIFAVYAVRSADELARRIVNGSNNWLIGPYGPVHEFYNTGGFTGGVVSTPGQFVAQASWQDGSLSRNFVNGSFVGSALGAGGGPGTFGLGTGGASYEPLDGDLAEVIAYDSALSEVNLANVWNYLATKYALT